MNLFVDTSVWSLALRRDARSDQPEIERLVAALQSGELVFTECFGLASGPHYAAP